MNDNIAQPVTLAVENLSKTFVLHPQGGLELPVLRAFDLTVEGGECVALVGPSGAGKSTILRCIYANYLSDGGRIAIRLGERDIDVLAAPPREILGLRKHTIGYVSQFLRVIPRIPTLDVVGEPLRATGVDRATAEAKARSLLGRLNIPERLWSLPPATFSGGEQQRVNVARGFVVDYPVLLLDEPTASLDRANRNVVMELINEATARGAAVVGIFHDAEIRDAVATRAVEIAPLAGAA